MQTSQSRSYHDFKHLPSQTKTKRTVVHQEMNRSRRFACRFSQMVIDGGDIGCGFDSQKNGEYFGGDGVGNDRRTIVCRRMNGKRR